MMCRCNPISRIQSLLLTLSLLIPFLLFPHTSWAGPATEFLNTQIKSIRSLLAQAQKTPSKRQEIDRKLLKVVQPLMNFPDMSQRVIGKRWKTLTPNQQVRFTALFQDLVFTSYMRRIRSANEDYTIEYEDESEDVLRGQKVSLVESIAKTKKAEIELIFALKALGEGQYEVFDVEIDSLGLVDNYKEQFIKIINRESFDALLKKMQVQLNRLKKETKKKK